jgi:hypothetical protein
MQVNVRNITFVDDKPKPGSDRLLAVFQVEFSGNHPPNAEKQCPISMVVNDFRYYMPIDADGYVAAPAIKTKHGTVRPIIAAPTMRKVILAEFIKVWEAIAPAPMTVPV